MAVRGYPHRPFDCGDGGCVNLTARMGSPLATIGGCLLFVAIGSATIANAQVVNSFRDLQGSLKEGERLTITEQSGVVTNGRFVRLADELLRVMAESGRGPSGSVRFSSASTIAPQAFLVLVIPPRRRVT
jgi:hypothetical protein